MKKPDIYSPEKRYLFTNWSKEDFNFKYANPDFQFIPPSSDEFSQKEIKRMFELEHKKNYFKTISIKAGSSIEVKEWLAFLLCKHFVDREFVKDVESRHGSLSRGKNDGKPNEHAESEILTMSSSSLRDELESRTIREIADTEESPVLVQLREQIRNEEIAKLKKLGVAELEAKEFPEANKNETSIEQGADVKNG